MFKGCPGSQTRFMVRKYGAGAILTHAPEPSAAEKKTPHMAVTWRERPGYMVGGEVATLLDRGYQKFWKSSRLEVPATAESLQAVHRFAEELRQVVGEPSLYNESLGTTSDSYLYDRVKGPRSASCRAACASLAIATKEQLAEKQKHLHERSAEPQIPRLRSG